MKISYQWLKDYLQIDLQAEVIAEYLTSTGLEVEGISPFESIRGGLKGVVIGEVLGCEKHPDADKLTLCKVDIGAAEHLSIVCGAPNVAQGQKVVVATIGASIFPYGRDEEIVMRKAKIRGVSSEGMICAEDELGIGPSHDGILVLDPDATVGQPASEYFGVYSDIVFEIGLTPNRTDAMSHFGVARDLAACIAFRENKDLPLREPKREVVAMAEPSLPISIRIENTEACKRYSGITLSDVQVGPSPSWLKNRLLAIGIKPHNNVVDVTNFVLHETGHPLHAFDYNQIDKGQIVVENLTADTPFTTLDGTERKLSDKDLMICDSVKPLCIAGVYGGISSGVTGVTRNIFLESAWFDPVSVRRSGRLHGLNTDASFRYERGADPGITVFALERAVTLICEVAGARVSSPILDEGEFAQGGYQKEIFLRRARANTIMGVEVSERDLAKILQLLGFGLLERRADGFLVRVPSYRADVTREIDVIEEVMRIYGMNNIHIPQSITVAFPTGFSEKPEMLKNHLAGYLIGNGFFEVWNNSLTSEEYAELLPDLFPKSTRVSMLNPLSQDLGVLRSTLLFGLLETTRHNLNRKWDDVRIFEFGAAYHHIPGSEKNDPVTAQYTENHVLAMMMTGMNTKESWYQPQTEVNVFDMKSYVDDLILLAGYRIEQAELKEDQTGLFDNGILYMVDQKPLARYGKVHSNLLKYFGVKRASFYAELNWSALTELFAHKRTGVTTLPKFPDVRRDLSLIIDKSVQFCEIRKVVKASDKGLVYDVLLFDVYEADSLPEGKKSYAIGIMLRDMEKTLSEREIESVMSRITQNLNLKLGAVLR